MARKRRRSPRFTQRGVALIAATVAIVIISVLTTEFSANTNIDYMAAANVRDNMRAQFLARSGVNLARLVIKVQTDLIDRNREQLQQIGMADLQLADYAGMFMGLFGGSKEEVGDLAELVGGFNAEAIEGLGVPAGEFTVDIGSEDGKINVNCAYGTMGSELGATLELIRSLLFPPEYDRVFQEPDADGWQRDRDTQATAIVDYIDPDSTRDSKYGGGMEAYGYETLRDPYEPKNRRLDTPGELRLVRGVDDRFWTLWGNAFTVYGACQMNIGALRDPNLIATIIAAAARTPDDPVVADYTKLYQLATRVIEAHGLSQQGLATDPLANLNGFVEFVKNPNTILQGLAGKAGEEGASAGQPSGGPPLAGVELDVNKLRGVLREGPRKVYRVEATATIGQMNKRITAIWDLNRTPQNTREDVSARGRPGVGAWVYWRED
jgi:general secretion pathway protein K